MAEGDWDYVVVGAGSAGCALAARLTEDPRNRVLLLEAGPEDSNPWIHLPIGYSRTFHDPSVNWRYQSEPEAGCGDRAIYQPRGRVLGGSSAINGLIYIRGLASDYDHWRQLGCAGWSYADVLPYFRKAEGNARGADDYHGAEGPLGVSDIAYRNRLTEAWIQSAVAAGLPPNPDFNGASQDGVGYYQLTVRDGKRASAAVSYLRPARTRPNLCVLTNVLATGLRLDGRQVTGVAYRRGGRDEVARAGRVVLSAGTFNTPQLLMLSGIGPGEELNRHGIAVRHELPGVGQNLQDHYQIRSMYRLNGPHSLNHVATGWVAKMVAGLRYALMRDGPLTVGAGAVGAFFRTRPEVADPDVQLHLIPFSTEKFGIDVHPFPGFMVNMNQSRPMSRGHVRLASPDPAEPPRLTFNYLGEAQDQATAVAGLKRVRDIAKAPPVSAMIAEELLPGPDVADGDDAGFLEFARLNGGSIYHPVGTAKMGTDAMAVVDPALKVHGLEGLYVADASIMPTLVSGNTNAAAVMIGEKAADLMRTSERAVAA